MFNKKLFFSLLVLINSSIALANMADNEEIYYAMLTEEFNPVPEAVGAVNYQKSVAGLTCTKSRAVYPGAEDRFNCHLSKVHDAKKIFFALNVVQINPNPRVVGSLNLEKTAGNLRCTRSRPVYPGAKDHYACRFLKDPESQEEPELDFN